MAGNPAAALAGSLHRTRRAADGAYGGGQRLLGHAHDPPTNQTTWGSRSSLRSQALRLNSGESDRALRPIKPISKLCRRLFRARRRAPGSATGRDRSTGSKEHRRKFGHTHAVMIVDTFWENVEPPRGQSRSTGHPAHRQSMLVACLWANWTDPRGKLPYPASPPSPTTRIPKSSAPGHDRTIISFRPREHRGLAGFRPTTGSAQRDTG